MLLDETKNANGVYNGEDITMMLLTAGDHQLGKCLEDIVTFRFIGTNGIGCVASELALHFSPISAVGVVAIRFAVSILFASFYPAPSQYRPNVSKGGLRAGKSN